MVIHDIYHYQKIIDKEAESIATKAIKLGDITAKEIMIPKVDMVTIQIDEDTDQIIEVIDSGHSEYPVPEKRKKRSCRHTSC